MRNVSFIVVLAVGCLACGETDAWRVYGVHPFVEVTADELPAQLRRPAASVSLIGLQNDWVHEAIAIAVDDETPAVLTLRLSGSKEVTEHISLRVVGFIKTEGLGYALGPIFEMPKDRDTDTKGVVRNFANIREFPTVTATVRDPVLIWITADTRGLAAGTYEGSIGVSGDDGNMVDIPLSLCVKPYRLPKDNPLMTWAWQWTPTPPVQKLEWLRLFHEYGVNVTIQEEDMELARKLGYRFFVFKFPPSFHARSLDDDRPEDADGTEIDQRMAAIKEMVAKLDLQPHQWAIKTCDEPRDAWSAVQIEWCEHIRRKWPEARFIFNPAGVRKRDTSVAGTFKPLAEYADVWLPYSHWLWDKRDPLAVMRQHGEQIWYYRILNFRLSRQPEVGRSYYRKLLSHPGLGRLEISASGSVLVFH